MNSILFAQLLGGGLATISIAVWSRLVH